MPESLSVMAGSGLFGGPRRPVNRGRVDALRRQCLRPDAFSIGSGFAALAADFERFVRSAPHSTRRSTSLQRPASKNRQPTHPVLFGTCAVTGCPSLGCDPTSRFANAPYLKFARGAFGSAPGDGIIRTAWLPDAQGGYQAIGVPRFKVDRSSLQFELPCVTPAAKQLAAHVRSGGTLSTLVDFDSLAEHHDGLTRVVTRAAVRGVMLTVGAGQAVFPGCVLIRVR